MGYKKRYRDLLESEKYRIRRNEQLLAALKRLEMRISFLSATTEKYKALRSKYQVFSNKYNRYGVVSNESPTGVAIYCDEFMNNSDTFNSMEKSNRIVNGHCNEKLIFNPLYKNHQNVSNPSYKILQNEITPESYNHVLKYDPLQIPRIYGENSRIQKKSASTNEISNDEIFSTHKNNIDGNENNFKGYEMNLSDQIRHNISNNSNDMSSETLKSESVERPVTNINKYAIINTAFHDSSTVDLDEDVIIPKTGILKMPEEISMKYQQGSDENIIPIPKVELEQNIGDSTRNPKIQHTEKKKNDDFQRNNMPFPSFITSGEKSETDGNTIKNGIQPQYVEIRKLERIHERNDMSVPETKNEEVEVENLQVTKTEENAGTDFERSSEIETYGKTIVEEGNDLKTTIGPEISQLNEQEIAQTILLGKLTLESNETTSQISLEHDQNCCNEEMKGASEHDIPIINIAIERTLDNLDFVRNIDPEILGVTEDTKLNNKSKKPESNKELEESIKLMHCQEQENSNKPENENRVETNELIEEGSGDGHLNDIPDLENSQRKETLYAPNEEAEYEENINIPKDQVVARKRQVETSNNNISDSNQNSQQETNQSILNSTEQNENSKDMRKSKKRSSDDSQNQYQYYDRNNQNYPVDEQGQQYDVSGHPISYDPGMPSTTQYDDKGQPYVPGYEAVYNEKGELVMPYDQNNQQYDQQYYQNDPNYANYDQYAQQYDDQQQYAEYDQQGYDPDQQTNYDESAHHQGYDPNSHYNAYYAEVKYNQDAFYQGDTQETVQNPQNEENEEVDKTNRLVQMLESDTENSSRQDNKVTTESDFDFSNN